MYQSDSLTSYSHAKWEHASTALVFKNLALNAPLTILQGEEGHSKAECTAPRKMGACFNCVCTSLIPLDFLY
jgi:hypothetical protein